MADKIKIELRQSDFWNILSCKRKMFLNNIANVSFGESQYMGAANKGTFLHGGLTGHYAGNPYMEGLVEQKKDFLAQGKDPEAVMEVFDMASSVVADYLRWVEREKIDQGLGDPVMVEERLRMKVYEDDQYEVWIDGQADLVFENKLVDFKTVDRIESPSPVLGIDSQLLTYLCLIWGTTPHRPKMASHRKILRKAYDGKSKAVRFAEHDIFVTEAQLKIHWLHMQSVAKQIVELYSSTQESLSTGVYPHLEAPPNPGRNCSFMCPFSSVCPSIDKTATQFQTLISVDPTEEFFK